MTLLGGDERTWAEWKEESSINTPRGLVQNHTLHISKKSENLEEKQNLGIKF